MLVYYRTTQGYKNSFFTEVLLQLFRHVSLGLQILKQVCFQTKSLPCEYLL